MDEFFPGLRNRARRIILIPLILLWVPVLAERVPGRYIVELTGDPVAEQVALGTPAKGVRAAIDAGHRAAVRNEQQAMRSRLADHSVDVVDSVDTVANALIVNVPDDDAAQLASIPGIKRVIPVRRFRMVLDRAVLLHRITDAWNQIAAGRAGEGVKIAIIDSGIDISHPGLQDPSITAPEGFPRTNSDIDRANTNSKVIVARSYVNLLPDRDPDSTARDHVGHGTALAMVAAGVRNTGPLATIEGVAPKAYLGSYKVFGTPGYNDTASDDAILKAIDDAVADGMDIINLSLGDPYAPRLEDDVDVQAVERAVKAGVIVVIAAGNSGPGLNTMSSPATAPSAISVGATTSDRTLAASVEIEGLGQFVAVPGSGSSPDTPLSAPIRDVASLDETGLGCSTLPADSLQNSLALIVRGTCTFEEKLNNAQQAGAVGAVVHAAESSPEPFQMYVGAAALPAEMVSNGDGVQIKNAIATRDDLTATLAFTLGSVSVVPNLVTSFSGAGPNVNLGIKPDLVADGRDMYVATQTLDDWGDMYDSSGYILVNGTSFSAPVVAGAAALLKSARPRLSVDQYRSLLINSTTGVLTRSGNGEFIQQSGAGLLDVNAAVGSWIAAAPVSLSFGSGTADIQATRSLTITNLSQSEEAFSITANPRGTAAAPVPEVNIVQLAPGASAEVPVSWNAAGLAEGTHDGFLIVSGTSTGIQARVPYWYAAKSGPAHFSLFDAIPDGRRNGIQRDAILLRITDSSGVVLNDAQPDVTVLGGGGTVRQITSYDAEIPGLIGITVQLGPARGENVFRVQAGSASVDVTIAGW